MSTILIIFTRIDGFTRTYFQNLFGEIQNENDFILRVENLLFVCDKKRDPEIYQLAPIINKLKEENTFYVFYHETSNALNAQQNFIRANILNETAFEINDHHNNDGRHFKYIVNAAEHYRTGNIQLFNEEIALLIKHIQENHGQ